MKKRNTSVAIILSLWAASFFIISCDSMNDIQEKFAEKEEQVYLGKVDSIKSFPGFHRAKITWYVGADPRIERTVIYWNMRNDSLVHEFNRTELGIQKDSVIIENLPEGTTLFEFRNTNNKEESSLYSSATVTIWGENFADELHARRLVSHEFDYEQSRYILNLSSVSPEDSLTVYSQVSYLDNQNVKKTVKIEREVNTVELPDFVSGKEYLFRNAFFLPQGIDTIYGSYQAIKTPEIVLNEGKKISLRGNVTSRYFERDGKSLYEWNAAGDIIVYNLNEDGTFSQTEMYASILPRSICRDFFFYDEDKFIAISQDGLVCMLKIVNGEPVFVKNPHGGDAFGSGFNMEKFISARKFFFAINGGYIKTWFAKDDASWDNIPNNGKTVGAGFIYDPVILFNRQYLVGIDADGNLWSIPITPMGELGVKNKIGVGWDRFKNIVSVGKKLLCLDDAGNFYQFDFDTNNYFWVLP